MAGRGKVRGFVFPAGRGRVRQRRAIPKAPTPASARRLDFSKDGTLPGRPAAGQKLGGRASPAREEEEVQVAGVEVVQAVSPAKSTLQPSGGTVGGGSPGVVSEESMEEEVPVLLPGPSQASAGSVPRKKPAEETPPARRRRVARASGSVVWDHFELCVGDPSYAICTHCKVHVSRGRDPKHYSTSGLLVHLQRRHMDVVEISADSGTRLPRVSSSSSTTKMQPVAPAQRRGKLTEWWVQHPGKRSDRLKPHLITRAIGEMIALDDQPFNIVCNVGFRRLLQLLAPEYKIPSRTTFSRRVVPSLYRACREAVLGRLRAAGPSTSVHFTADLWMSRSGLHTAFMSLTAHWWGHGGEVASESAVAAPMSSHACKPCWAVLHVEAMDADHKSEELVAVMDWQVESWLSGETTLKRGFMVTDNTANITKAAKQVYSVHIACTAHTLNLVVQDALGLKEAKLKPSGFQQNQLSKIGVGSSTTGTDASIAALVDRCRKIAGHFHRSKKARHLLKARQTELGLPEHLIPQDFPTRWNSTYLLLQRLQEQGPALHIMVKHGSLEVCDLSDSDWKLIAELVLVLEPFHSATSSLSTEAATLSQALPVAFLLEKNLAELQSTLTTGEAIALAGRLRAGVVERLRKPLGSSAWHVLACMCDPRMKTKVVPHLELEKWRGILVEHVRCAEEKRLGAGKGCVEEDNQEEGACAQPGSAHSTPCSSATTTSSKSSSAISLVVAPEEWPPVPPQRSANCWFTEGFEDALPGESEEPAPQCSRAEESVAQYLSEPREDKVMEPFLFWATHRQVWPDLATVAVWLLSCPPTRVSSERLFSMAGDVVSPLRSRLDAELVEQLVFLKANLPLLDFPELAVEGE
ncbi:zinc finger BED domain-containing protein 4-like [Hemicordylus capensis]|uniref:zinc finger BED domain-containing protein 4-like n=1 Tax=Hemicordylus capensis TaxID=884348 RepID=UPI002303F41D|nr:zinc finger BED domain-containing protein 4-like [Hemicordylus capensis]XP_053146663.1 zinc finger BED domain-containing protein 4-like [Hemicordylus capensis]XP_053146664.1 zinc finger BED domain-containing protein 4-like [Hemicordylus capensis]XP_053146665.1 zinc finger BED domain-containing protein 4-like [Hemicordylus capensis]XP_053146666.1 zinc finger BED domain-containing protein 4-like [Hemicordylus capensis]XP_053146667.1 zinc finger BED domain-containing protein 4-like [Hemicordyl